MSRLERDGIVKRHKSKQDQRLVFVSLTERGEACFAAMSDDMERNYQKIQDQFGQDKLEQLLALLSELKRIEP